MAAARAEIPSPGSGAVRVRPGETCGVARFADEKPERPRRPTSCRPADPDQPNIRRLQVVIGGPWEVTEAFEW